MPVEGLKVDTSVVFLIKNMAEKRMFSKQIVDTDAFLEMPASSQLLYFHLAMRADDEGFVGSPKKIMKMCGFGDDDLKVLIAKRFLLAFESGVVVIKHWLIHNTIRMDRFNPTNYQREKETLQISENKAYTDHWQPLGNHLEPQVKLSKVNLSKVNTVCVKKSFTNSKGKEINLEVAEDYIPDGFSPLKAKQAKRAMERVLGKNKTTKWSQLLFGSAWDFMRAYQNFQGQDYVGDIIVGEVAKNLATWYEQGETRETMQQMIIAFFGSEKAEKVTITPNSVFSTHTYNSWKQGKLIQKNKTKEWL